MTVQKLSLYQYIGLSTDTLPTDAANGARFLEFDHHHELINDNGTWRDIELITTDSAHQHIHNGEEWMISDVSAGVANGATMDMVYTTLAEEMHTTFQMTAEGDALYEVFEGTALNATPGGSAAIVKNANRTVGDAGAPTVLTDPTIDTDGTLIFTQNIPGGIGGNSPGGQADRNTEIVLAASTNYLFRITNGAGVASDLSIALRSYEHD